MKKGSQGLPHDSTPDVHQFRGIPESCFDLINQYGTYEIQATTNTENVFPLIGACRNSGRSSKLINTIWSGRNSSKRTADKAVLLLHYLLFLSNTMNSKLLRHSRNG